MEILRFPLVRIALWFVPGIILAYYMRLSIPMLTVCIVIALTGLLLTYWFARSHFRQKLYFGVCLSAAAFCAGAMTQAVHDFTNNRSHYVSQIDETKDHDISLTLKERLKNSKLGARYIAEVSSLDNKIVSGKILLHFKGQSQRMPVGTQLVAVGKILQNKRPLNPDQFDYGKYLNDKSIPAQLYLQNDNYKIYGIAQGLWHDADFFRNRIIETLRKNGFREAELQVLHALILGQQQEISPEIVKNYQFAGAVHILSVSGLHVGFILLFLNFLLKPLPKSTRWNAVRLGIVLISLWGFAFIAGLSPSVVRSATMFSFVAVGMNLRRSTNIFHTLIVSLLLILLFEPAFLFDVGFQLSYAALFFILWLQPLISDIWQPKNSVVKYFWDIVTVSFAAQIGTLPLSVYYFHQFPTLFFITNLVVIPMLSVIMALGIAVMLPAAFGYPIKILAYILEWGIALLNRIIGNIASWEQFVLTDIPCNFLILVTAYLMIAALIIWLRKPSGARLILAGVMIFCFQLSVTGTIWSNRNRSEFLVLNFSKKTLLIEKKKAKITAFGNVHPMVSNYSVAHFCERPTFLPARNTYWFNRKKILVLEAPDHLSGANADVVIFSQSPKINLERWLKNHRPSVIVADASNYATYISRWKATCEKQKIPFHYTKEKGFFKLSD